MSLFSHKGSSDSSYTYSEFGNVDTVSFSINLSDSVFSFVEEISVISEVTEVVIVECSFGLLELDSSPVAFTTTELDSVTLVGGTVSKIVTVEFSVRSLELVTVEFSVWSLELDSPSLASAPVALCPLVALVE